MKFFFTKNIPVDITEDVTLWNDKGQYDVYLEGNLNREDYSRIGGKILAKADEFTLDQFLYLPRSRNISRIEKITLLVNDLENITSIIKEKYGIVRSAGGLVTKGDSVLMVYRMGRWELPKGRIEEGESSEEAAVREVQEECNVTAKLGDWLCSTWYSYLVRGKLYFKNIEWFEMTNIEDSDMKPQYEEGITKVSWIPKDKLPKVLSKSFLSIRHIFDEYLN